jgi:hypothetical protein
VYWIIHSSILTCDCISAACYYTGRVDGNKATIFFFGSKKFP